MERRTVLAFFLILAFLMVYSRFLPHRQTQPLSPQEVKSEAPPQNLPGKPGVGWPAPQPDSPAEPQALPQKTLGDFIITYSPKGGYIKSLSLESADNKLPFEDIGFIPADSATQYAVFFGSDRIRFEALGGVDKEFIFRGNTLEIKISPPLSTPLLLFSNNLHPSMLNQRYQEVFSSVGGTITRRGAKKVKEETLEDVEFAGARDRYYCISLLKGEYRLQWVKETGTSYLYLLPPLSKAVVYIGPQIEKNLQNFELQGVMYYGFFHALGMIMTRILYFLYAWTKNWGISLILFAVFIYLLLFPFTVKSTRAIRRMQLLQPEIETMKAKYKDNPQKLQKETLELYRRYKVNPLGGCLPLFFQFPIFIALYQVLFRFVGLKGAHFLWIKDLSLPDRLLSLPFPAPVNYLNLLPLLIMAVGLLQQKVTSGVSATAEQKKMGLFFGVFLGVIFYNFPAALTLYWLVQSLLTFIYQARMNRVQTALVAS